MKAEKGIKANAVTSTEPDISKLLEQYGSGPVKFTGASEALY